MPLFEVNDDTETLKTAHHPFTHPHPDDFHLLNTNPLKVNISIIYFHTDEISQRF